VNQVGFIYKITGVCSLELSNLVRVCHNRIIENSLGKTSEGLSGSLPGMGLWQHHTSIFPYNDHYPEGGGSRLLQTLRTAWIIRGSIKRDTTFLICIEDFGNYIKWPPSGKYLKELFYKKENWHGIPDGGKKGMKKYGT
jgi:hypothetical protein